jgi:hypothetical protein
MAGRRAARSTGTGIRRCDGHMPRHEHAARTPRPIVLLRACSPLTRASLPPQPSTSSILTTHIAGPIQQTNDQATLFALAVHSPMLTCGQAPCTPWWRGCAAQVCSRGVRCVQPPHCSGQPVPRRSALASTGACGVHLAQVACMRSGHYVALSTTCVHSLVQHMCMQPL